MTDTPGPAKEIAELQAAKAGDLAAFERILERCGPQVLRVALALLRDRADAEVAAQEVFVRLHRHLRSFDQTRPFAPWLYRLTVNVCRDLGRKRPPGGSEPRAPLAAAGPGPEEMIQQAERRKILAAALETLTAKEREAVVLRDLEGVPTREVARLLGSTEATIRSHLSNARLKLRACVKRMS